MPEENSIGGTPAVVDRHLVERALCAESGEAQANALLRVCDRNLPHAIGTILVKPAICVVGEGPRDVTGCEVLHPTALRSTHGPGLHGQHRGDDDSACSEGH